MLYGWNIQRILFLVAGGFVLIQSIIAGEWLGAVMGGYFASMGLFALGCASGNCLNRNAPIPPHKNINMDVEYEEITNTNKNKV